MRRDIIARGMAGLRRQLAESASAFGAVLRNRDLRPLELGWAASIIGTWGYNVAVSVYAYRAGGASAVGIVSLVRMLPAAFVSPFAGLLADRYRRERVLLLSISTKSIILVGTAILVFGHATPWAVYGLAVAATIAGTPQRSAQGALTPVLCSSPGELTAANAVTSTIESLGSFIGPAIAGVVLGLTSMGVVFSLTAGLLVVSVLFTTTVRGAREAETAPKAELEASTIASESLAGFRAIGKEPSLRVLVALFTAQTFVAGAVGVFTVVISIQVLGLGNAGVGYLNSAFGVGAILGGVVALGLTGAKRLSPSFLVGVVLWGAPLALVTLSSSTTLAFVLFGVMGVGNSLVDVAGFTLVQRAVPDNVLARVFGVIMMLWLVSIGVGAAIAPVLISWLGRSHALIVTGLGLVALVVVFAARVVAIDNASAAPDMDELRLLGRVPIFSPLAGATLEHLAGRLVPLVVEPGTEVVAQGGVGDRFYVVAEGDLDVSADGRPLSTLHVGDYFGEIALLRDVPRTASVTTRTRTVLYALDREDFLAAVTGYAPSAQAAERVVGARLAAVPAAGVGAGP
jgi:MFS family permease